MAACLPAYLPLWLCPSLPPSFPRDRVSVSMSLMPSSFPPSATNLPHVVLSLPGPGRVDGRGRRPAGLPPAAPPAFYVMPIAMPNKLFTTAASPPLPLSRSLRSRYSVGTEAQKNKEQQQTEST